MRRVSVRTLVLLMELLAFVVAYQCLDWTKPAKADVIWLAPDVVEAGEAEP
jgi:hypothetical protein